MKAATHVAFAGLTGVIAAGLGAEVGIVGGAALAAGSLIPDMDTTTSGLGRWVKPVSGLVERKFGHRTLTHSFLGLLLLGVLASPLIFINFTAWLWLLVGAATHILLDAHNITGVPLLYPLRLEFVSVTNRGLRTPYGSPREFVYLAAFSLAAVGLMPFAHDGFAPWFHRALGAPYGAVEDYLEWRNEFEVYADINGVNLLTNEDVSGRYRIIDVLERERLLVEDEMGRAFSAALKGADIQITKVKAWKGQPIVSSTYRIDLNGRLMSDLIHSLPKGANRIYVNAGLELSDNADIAPALGYFSRVTASGKTVEARAATVGDLAQLSRYVIRSGSAVIRAEYSPGSEALATIGVANAAPEVKSHLLNIPNLPTMAGLTVAIGDELTEGELIARYVDDAALEVHQAEADAALEQVPGLEARVKAEREAHEAKLIALEQAQADAQVKLEQIDFMVERGAEPRNSLIEAQSALRRAETAVLMEKTSWTSELTRLESQLREANLTIAKAEGRTQDTLEKQWVKAPVFGIVSDIRVAEVTVKGVSLELVILETKELADELPQQDAPTVPVSDLLPA